MKGIQIMTKYIKVRFYKKYAVYTLFIFNAHSIEMVDVTLEKNDQEKEILIVRELCGLYEYTITYQDAQKRLLEKVYHHV